MQSTETNPADTRPSGRAAGSIAARVAALLALGFASLVFVPFYVSAFRPPRLPLQDFYQEWASARNFWNGLPVYEDHLVSLRRYFGPDAVPQDFRDYVHVNGHPPTSVLLALPLGLLDYATAFSLWYVLTSLLFLAGVGLLLRQVQARLTASAVLFLAALLLAFNPLLQHLKQGQLSIPMFFLVTLAWTSDRSRRPYLAGACVGLATVLKLFPGLLVIYFLATRQWRSLLAAAATVAAVGLAALIVLGAEPFAVYFGRVAPMISTTWINYGLNASLPGLWNKLLAQGNPLLPSFMARPDLAKAAIVASTLIVCGGLLLVTRRAGTTPQRDHAWGATTAAMLLLSPVAWDHSLVLTLLPLALLWRDRRCVPAASWLLLIIVPAIWLNPSMIWTIYHGGSPYDAQIRPWEVATLYSYQCYALVALWAAAMRLACRRAMTPAVASRPC